MKEMLITTKVEVLDYNELNETQLTLTDLAKEATKGAYTPYSHFNVGAALLLENGVMVKGANQENAALGSTMCAERSTIYWASSQYPGVKFKALAIAAFTKGDFVENPISPCGACRQSLMEYENLAGAPIEVLLCGRDKVYRIEGGVRALLPLTFTEF